MNNRQNDFTDTALRLLRQAGAALWRFTKRTGRWLESIIVGKAMRALVRDYDRRRGICGPPAAPAGRKTASAETEDLSRQLSEARKACDAAKRESAQKDEELRQARQEAENERQLAEKNLQQALARKDEEAEKLRREIEQLRSRLNAGQQKKAAGPTLLYAEADASSPCLRKVTLQPDSFTQYVIETGGADHPDEGTFRIYEEADHARIIENRVLSLLACDVASIAANPTRIVTEEPGAARREGAAWRVVRPARIRIV